MGRSVRLKSRDGGAIEIGKEKKKGIECGGVEKEKEDEWKEVKQNFFFF